MICLFGGTFDPVHNGHLHAAGTVCAALALQQIRLVLAARPRHREQPATPVEHRWRMLELACESDARFVPDDREVRRATPSYTVETLLDLRGEFPGAKLVWVLGSDQYRGLPSWHRWRDILTLTNLVVLMRPGEAVELDPAMQQLTRERRVAGAPTAQAGQVSLLETPMLDISATRIRSDLAAGRGVEHLLPLGVYTYIKRHGLYGVISDP